MPANYTKSAYTIPKSCLAVPRSWSSMSSFLDLLFWPWALLSISLSSPRLTYAQKTPPLTATLRESVVLMLPPTLPCLLISVSQSSTVATGTVRECPAKSLSSAFRTTTSTLSYSWPSLEVYWHLLSSP